MSFNNPRRSLVPFILLIAILAVFSISAVSGQTFLDKKDLIFTQVFAGPAGGTTYASYISVTNRGLVAYNGDLFFTTGNNAIWNPIVNGAQVTGGSVTVTILPDETQVFAITTNTFTVGYAFFYSEDYSLDNYVEGNLSYFAFNGSTLMDAVGVPESKEFLNSTLPFDMYADVGLSLVNPSATAAANVGVILFDEDGGIVANCNFTLQAGEHYAKYLTELPWYNAPVGFGPVGKVEVFVTNGVPISGIAMLITPGSAAGAQISTLPLGGTPLTYEITFNGAGDIAGEVYVGNLTLWIEGFFVKGYLQMTSINGSPVDNSDTLPILVNGQLVGTELDLAFFTGPAHNFPGPFNYGSVLYMYIMNYDPAEDSNGDDAQDFAVWYSLHAWDTGMKVEGGSLVIDNTLF